LQDVTVIVLVVRVVFVTPPLVYVNGHVVTVVYVVIVSVVVPW